MDLSNPAAASSPNLSQYFVNDPPSFFDELAGSGETKSNGVATAIKTMSNAPLGSKPVDTAILPPQSSLNSYITTETFNGYFKPAEYIENLPEVEEEMKIPDDIRGFWLPAINEPGVPPLLTMPGICTPNELPDVIAQVVSKHLGEAELIHRKILTIDDVTQDERGVRTLITAGCYRVALNLTGRLLTIYGQGHGRIGQPAKHSPHSLQLWFSRLALLNKLGEYKLLQAEAEPFDQLNKPDVYYEFYPEMYEGKKGSMACFSFRLMLAELSIHTGNAQLALDRLSEMYVLCNEIRRHFAEQKSEVGEELWRRREKRVLHSIINCALHMKKFNLIDDIINNILLKNSNLTREERRALFSFWGRIYLHYGDIFGAEQKFAEARRLRDIKSPPDLRDLVDKGLLTVAQNDFPEAFAVFQKALHIETGNTMILNNMGVCLLYAGKLKDAINLFERAINLNPQKSLNESLLVNLSTLYELESNNSKTKKLNLLRLINRYKPDLNISLEICLKLQSKK